MAFQDQEDRIDEAFESIDETILPCIGLALETLLEAAERGATEVPSMVYAQELRALGLQLEALTKEIGYTSPARQNSRGYRLTTAA